MTPSAELGEPPLEETPLGLGVDELERPDVRLPGLVHPLESDEQVGTRCVEIVVAVELERVDGGERGPDVARLGDRDRTIQLDDRRSREPRELAVQLREPGPV